MNQLLKEEKNISIELNNNSPNNNNVELFNNSYKRNRNESIASVSSASSYHSDSSEEVEGLSQKESLQDFQQKDNDDKSKEIDFQRVRSMSDGAACSGVSNPGAFEIFPSLPDSVLEKMGLLGNGTRERMSEEELEQKFISLALAFTIDAATVKDRNERQRRYRDQTETNLNVELERLIEKASRIQPLCIDLETTELLSALLSQIDIVTNAASLAATSAERYGAVQQEQRLTESVSLMISHVNLLKQQRDSARRQLQYTKKVLQDSNSNQENTNAKSKISSIPNGRIINKRRASIATIARPQDLHNRTIETRKIIRRTSDLSLRASSISRSARPSRLELGVDLVKIKEGMSECDQNPNDHATENQSDYESNQNEEYSSPEDNESKDFNNDIANNVQLLQDDSLRCRTIRRFRRYQQNIELIYNKWTENGTMHEICCFCALMCFSISVITLANIFIEIEFARRGLNPSKFFWYFTSGS